MQKYAKVCDQTSSCKVKLGEVLLVLVVVTGENKVNSIVDSNVNSNWSLTIKSILMKISLM